ncbi:MAG: L-glutamate gamma-semialdehyde dehydrogenase [Lachnospiraceae bacterium]|nr:L-glutamate gamma-semialdehyde dehydrogenase [Lachnospiraceae bacterium]
MLANYFENAKELDFTCEEHKAKLLEAFKQVDAEKGNDYPLIIGGEKITTEKKITSINPGNKEVLGQVSSCSKELGDKAIETAYETFKTWSNTCIDERVRCVKRLVHLVDQNRYYLDAWNVLESGKNWGEADGELCEALDFFNSYAKFAEELDKGLELQPSNELTKAVYIPIGVGCIIPPWNFPFSIMAGMCVAALVTGNTFVCKPSSDTPITCYKFMELVKKAGFPDGAFNYIPGRGSDIGDSIVDHPLTRFINFTGSKEVGCRIFEHAAHVNEGQIWLKRVVAEMGGKNAIIVDSTADLKKAAQGVAGSAFTFQGQKCSACSRALVLADVYDDFVKELVAVTKEMTADQGEGRDNKTCGPVINQGSFDNVVKYIKIGEEEGTIACGGKYSDEKGFYLEPTIVTNVSKDARVANEEIFGPVCAVVKVNSFQEALDVANQTEYGLTGSVYSENRANIQQAKREFNVGNLYFNRKSTAAVVLNHPFGGVNMSGTDAKTGTRDYLQNFMCLKSITEDLD